MHESDITPSGEADTRLNEITLEHMERNQLTTTLFNCMAEGVVVVDADGKLAFVNPSAERLIGISATDCTPGKCLETRDIFHADGQMPLEENDFPIVRALRGESVNEVEVLLRSEDNPRGIYVSVNATSLKDSAGKVKGAISVLRDITALRKAKADLTETVEELKRQTTLTKTVFNSMSDGVIVVDRNGKCLLQTPAFQALVGTHTRNMDFDKRAETLGFYRMDRATPFSAEDLPLSRSVRGKPTDGTEMFIRNRQRPNGAYISINSRPLRDESGAVIGGVSVCRDVTGIKETERKLKQTADRLREQTRTMEAIFNSISEGVAVFDTNGKCILTNPSGERITGVGMIDADPERWAAEHDLHFPDGVTPFPNDELPHIRALRGESSDEVMALVRNRANPDGIYVAGSGRPILDAHGVVTGSVIVFRDITERYLTEEALMQAFARGRNEIVETILHNIGNAINSVAIGVGTIHEQLHHNKLLGRISALAKAIDAHRDDPVAYLSTDPQGRLVIPFIVALADDLARQNDQLRRTVERVQGRVAHITEIIRTQSPSTEGITAHKDIVLRQTIFDSIEVLQDSIDELGIRMHVDCIHAPAVVTIQENRFQQMLLNLVKNAVEAIEELSDSGEHDVMPCIRITARLQGSRLVIDVADNGIGIDPSRIRNIFTPGYTTKTGGSGLGLHSAASFAASSGGSIVPLSNGIGTGTTMRVSLRLLPGTPNVAGGQTAY